MHGRRERHVRYSIHDLWRDLSVAQRRLRRTPTATLLISATLAIGIGLGAVVFMVADSAVFRPPPFLDPAELIAIQTNTGGTGWYGASEPEYWDLRHVEEFSELAAWTGGEVTFGEGTDGRQLPLVRGTSALLPLLGIEPALGRFATPQEHVEGADPVVVIGDSFWRNVLGADPDVLDEPVLIDGRPTRVLAVMPPGFSFPTKQFQLWMPMQLDPEEPWGRNNHYLSLLGRLRHGIDLGRARAAVDVITARAVADHPDFYSESGYRTRLEPLQRLATENQRAPMVLLLGAVGLLLLLACANVANLQLGRILNRSRELQIARALGASRGRILGELLSESTLLSIAGVAGALGVALIGQQALPRLVAPELFQFAEPALDRRVLIVTMLAGVAATLLAGVLPALRFVSQRSAADNGQRESLRSRSIGGRTRATRTSLVISQMALSTALLLGCGATIRSLQHLLDVDLGYEADRVLMVDLRPNQDAFEEDSTRIALYRSIEESVLGVPGVEAAGSLARPPRRGGGGIWSIVIDSNPEVPRSQAPAALVQQATPGAFQALGIQVLAGRTFEEFDRQGALPVVVVNQAFARRFWPDEEALGRQMRVFADDGVWMTVVGVVEDVRDRFIDQPGEPQWYVPHAQAFDTAYVSPRDMTLVVRTSLDAPLDVAGAVLARVQEVDARVVSLEPVALDSVEVGSVALARQLGGWFAIFALTSLTLAGVGLYGMISYLVTERHREFGLRLALGAKPGTVFWGVQREGLRVCALGLAVGAALGFTFLRIARSTLFEVDLFDPGMLLATVLSLTAVGLLAPLRFGFRASRVAPSEALRG